MSEKIGYDELLQSRVEQLKTIDERLEDIGKKSVLYSVTDDIRRLRNDVAAMIRNAEAEHTAF